MIPTLGHVAVLVGLAASLYAVAAFVLGGRRADAGLTASGRTAIHASFALAGLACAAMVWSLLAHDFSVLYVARNNATTTPPWISVISLWAALEGSILFWTLLATGWAALVLHRYRDRHRALMPWVGATLASVNTFFFAVMTWPGSPFTRVSPVAAEGPGPNALLQNHPFMALHPPLLYLGYTGLAVPFAFAVAALITRRSGEEWLAIVRRWTLVPWIFLSVGIVAGAWWAYEVLGWGGYWAWDPVENAALLPWLTATAFFHSAMVAERRGGLRTWTTALIIATFVLTLVGTFLTRSGVVQSVHSFTQSGIGSWFLGAIVIALGASLALLLWRLPDMREPQRASGTVSRESAFLLNNVLFLTLTFVVLFGTLLPVFVSITAGETISVGAPWFNQVGVPIIIVVLFLMGVGPALPWGGASWATLRERFAAPVLVALAVPAAAMLLGVREPAPLVTLGLAAFVAWTMGEELVRGARARSRARGENPATATWRLTSRNRRRYGGYTVHLGVLTMAIAIAVSSTLQADTVVTLEPGESIALRGYEVTHDRLVQAPLTSDPRVVETAALVSYAGSGSGELRPALRDYPNSALLIATPAVRTTPADDLYVTLMSYDGASGSVTLHVFVKPLVLWIWIGGGIVALGALFAAWPDRRRRAPEARVSAPSREPVAPLPVEAAVIEREGA